jgi:hypothetical protein
MFHPRVRDVRAPAHADAVPKEWTSGRIASTMESHSHLSPERACRDDGTRKGYPLRTPRSWWVTSILSARASAGLLLGCYATAATGTASGAQVAPDDYVYEDAPPQIETYPVVVYEGAPHYYVNGRWYRRTPRGWAYYRSEPPHLAARRPPPRREERKEEHGEEHKEERREGHPDEHHGEHHDEHHDEHHEEHH